MGFRGPTRQERNGAAFPAILTRRPPVRYFGRVRRADVPGVERFLELDGQGTHAAGQGSLPCPTLTLAQAAQAWGVTVKTVRRRIAAGAVAAVKVEGPHGPEWRVPAAVQGTQDGQGTLPAVQGTLPLARVDTRGEVEFLRARLVQAEEREADLRRQLAAALRVAEEAQRARFPWQSCSEPPISTTVESPRRWWQLWRPASG